MNNISQKTIDQYLEGSGLNEAQKEKIILAITYTVYQRNNKVVKAEMEKDELKKAQFLRSIEEYDQIIKQEMDKVLKGEKIHPYDL